MLEGGYEKDRKDIGDYNFIKKSEPLKELNCYKCDSLIQDVPYYEQVEESINKSRLHAKTCEKCGINELDSLSSIEDFRGKLLCGKCRR
jgi:hypothetical protein